jgi:hypothetical protein
MSFDKLEGSIQKSVPALIHDVSLIGIEYVVKQLDYQRDAGSTKESKHQHGHKTRKHKVPIPQHHPVYKEQIAPSVVGIRIFYHNSIHKEKLADAGK